MLKIVFLLSVILKVTLVTSFYLDNEFADVSGMSDLIKRLKENSETHDVQVNTNDLPANYHNKTSSTEQVGNHKVKVETVVDKVTNPKTGSQSVSVIETVGGHRSQCNTTRDCKTGDYCLMDIMGNVCAKCSTENTYCTTDQQCCGGTKSLLCVRHRCKAGITKGSEGTICKTSTDCNAGLCCPKSMFDFSVSSFCTKFRAKGESCKTSDDIMGMMGTPQCPCGQGLACKPQRNSKRGFDPFSWIDFAFPFSKKTCQVSSSDMSDSSATSNGENMFDGFSNFMEDEKFRHQKKSMFNEFDIY